MGRRGWLVLGITVALALLAPQVLGTFWISLLIQILVFGLLALSVDLLLGHTGIFPLGHAAFFALAAYTTAILQDGARSAEYFSGLDDFAALGIDIRLATDDGSRGHKGFAATRPAKQFLGYATKGL